MKLLGIWTKELSLRNLNTLHSEGFNAIFLPIGFNYEYVKRVYSSASESWPEYTAEEMKYDYEIAKTLGFKFFLIDCGWGLGELDNNFFYEKIIEKFKNCEDVYFYLGEPIESFVEPKTYTWQQVQDKIIQPRIDLMPLKNLYLDATTRNFIQLYKSFPGHAAISSYFNQHTYWTHSNPWVWIYGQLKFGGSLQYKKLAMVADSLNIEMRFLYQGDPDTWSWKDPSSWLNAILKWLHLGKWFEALMRKRFIKIFS